MKPSKPSMPKSLAAPIRAGLLVLLCSGLALCSAPAAAQLGFGDAPGGLVAMPLSQFQVELEWQDRSPVEEGFEVQKRAPGQEFHEVVAVLPADSQRVTVGDLTPGLPYEFRVRAVQEGFSSPWVSVHATPPDFQPCGLDPRSLCLLGDRFRVQVHWVDPFDGAGQGEGHPSGFDGSDESGIFWFFDDANVELVVKVLDARAMGSGFWVFHGALTAVEYWVTVTDQEDFTSRTYYNPPREQCGLADTRAFPVPWGPPEFAGPTAEDDLRAGPGDTGAAASSASSPLGDADLGGLVPFAAAGDVASGTCVPTDTDLCLQDGRFRVQVDWRDPRSGARGTGLALPGSVANVPADTTGFFWFFDGDNIELAVKMIDGTPVNGRYWFFFGGLTDVGYTITVTDTVGGGQRTFFSAAGDICGGLDVRAFEGGGGTP